MWVMRFYLNANKTAFSETVIRGCGGAQEGGKERKRVLCPLLSQQLDVVRQVPPVPAAPPALFGKLTPQAASSCTPLALPF